MSSKSIPLPGRGLAIGAVMAVMLAAVLLSGGCGGGVGSTSCTSSPHAATPSARNPVTKATRCDFIFSISSIVDLSGGVSYGQR